MLKLKIHRIINKRVLKVETKKLKNDYQNV